MAKVEYVDLASYYDQIQNCFEAPGTRQISLTQTPSVVATSTSAE